MFLIKHMNDNYGFHISSLYISYIERRYNLEIYQCFFFSSLSLSSYIAKNVIFMI